MTWKDVPTVTDILDNELFIGNSKDDLNAELKNNMWSIAVSLVNQHNLVVDELLDFIQHIIINRREQLNKLSSTHGMYFYIWQDRQASQLRFSLISDVHRQLPFKSDIALCEIKEIIEDFLTTNDYIPYAELEITDASQESMWESEIIKFVLLKYINNISPSIKKIS